jgi:hypothetical protein
VSVTKDKLCSLRPYSYHLTHVDNVRPILARGELLSCAELLRVSGGEISVRERRPEMVSIELGGNRVFLRDQRPLHAGNVSLEDDWEFADLVEHINGHVFFWPGIANGPIGSGQRHFDRYAAENPAILRVRTADLFEANVPRAPLYCKYNSGAPRCTGGQGSPRGKQVYIRGDDAEFGVGGVVEVLYRRAAKLPGHAVEVRRYRNREWVPASKW